MLDWLQAREPASYARDSEGVMVVYGQVHRETILLRCDNRPVRRRWADDWSADALL